MLSPSFPLFDQTQQIEKLEKQVNELTVAIEQSQTSINQYQTQLKKNQEEIAVYQNELTAYVNREAEIRTYIETMNQPGNENLALNANFIEKLGELVSKEDRKAIPVNNGSGSGTSLFDWLREAERIARNNEWTDSQKIHFFGDRLRGDAADWHSDYLESHPNAANLKTKMI